MKVALFIMFIVIVNAGQAQTQSPAKALESEKASSGASHNSDAGNYKYQVSVNPSNSVAWEQYYLYERNKNINANHKVIKPSTQVKLDSILVAMKSNVGQSFEFNYLSYINSNYDVNAFHFLEKAYEIDPSNNNIYDEFVAHYIITGNETKRKEFSKKISSSKKYSANSLEYAYNLLQSVGLNGVLITNGEVDTYPLLVQQDVFGVRPDVRIINLDLLKVSDYRETYKKKSGINLTYAGSEISAIKKIISDNTGYDVHLSLTVKPALLKALQSNLYLTGLCFKYSNSAVNNISLIEANWNRFRKSKIGADNYGEDAQLNNNYLMMLVQLYESKSDTNYKQFARSIATSSGVWTKVENKFQ